MSERQRQPLAAQMATRAMIERALAVDEPRLTATELRVLLAVIARVSTYDRLEDRLANSVLVADTGTDARRVRRALTTLTARGVIGREPGSSLAGAGRQASLVRLTGGTTAPPVSATPGLTDPPYRGCETPPVPGVDLNIDRGSIWTATGGPQIPASEVLSEEGLSEGEGAERDLPEDLALDRRASLARSTLIDPDRYLDELLGELVVLDATHANVDAALAALAGHRFRWPSKVIAAMENHLERRTRAASILDRIGARSPAAPTSCPACASMNGWTEGDRGLVRCTHADAAMEATG